MPKYSVSGMSSRISPAHTRVRTERRCFLSTGCAARVSPPRLKHSAQIKIAAIKIAYNMSCLPAGRVSPFSETSALRSLTRSACTVSPSAAAPLTAPRILRQSGSFCIARSCGGCGSGGTSSGSASASGSGAPHAAATSRTVTAPGSSSRAMRSAAVV